MIRLVLAWVMLLLLLAVDVLAALLHTGWLAWATAPVMVAVVALAFMNAARESPLSRIFAVTGLIWMTILLTLGSADFLARHNELAPQKTIR